MRHHAVVIGGSVAGLMAAEVLSRHFGAVTVLDRDTLTDNKQPNATLPRKGVPQGQHVHVLLNSGLQALAQCFPGFLAEMQQDGVDKVAWSEQMRWFQHGNWKTRVPCGLDFYPQGRPALEARIRARVRRNLAIALMGECRVQGLLFGADKAQVRGVHFETEGQTHELRADLVVDAGGRGSGMLGWLTAQGYAPPPKEAMAIDLVYVSRVYRQPAGASDLARDWKGLAVHPLPASPRGGILLPLDGQRWIVTLFGYAGAHPGSTPEDFLAFTRSLPVPDLHAALQDAEPLSAPVRYAYPQQVWQRFDQVRRFPAGLLPLGDVVCSVDPVFGQGMTLACQQALALDRLLTVRRGSAAAEPVHRAYFRACKAIIEVPWLITQAEALRFAATPGRRSLKIRLLQAYTGQVFALSAQHVGVYRAFLDVMHLMAGPSALFRPAVLGRVLLRALVGLLSGVLAPLRLFRAPSPGAPPAPNSPSSLAPAHVAGSGRSAAPPATTPTTRPGS